jgi:hypothetical protein
MPEATPKTGASKVNGMTRLMGYLRMRVYQSPYATMVARSAM